VKAVRRLGLPVQKVLSEKSAVMPAVAEGLNYVDVEALYAAIGEGHVSAASVGARINKELSEGDPEQEQLPLTVRQPRRSRRSARGTGVHVEGLDDVMVRLSRCCTPVPGDDIIGFVTRGRGVSVHRADCANAVSLTAAQGDRLIDVDWDRDAAVEFVASIEVKALDRARLLQEVIAVLSDNQANIIACSTHTGSDRVAKMRLDFELSDPTQIDRIVANIRGIDGVYDSYRVLPGTTAKVAQ
jgi:GTP pyrophosphokinase